MSTETIRTIRDKQPMTSTSTLTQLPSSAAETAAYTVIYTYLTGTNLMRHPATDAILYGQLVAHGGGSNEEPPGFDAADATHRVEVFHWAAVVWHHLEPTCQQSSKIFKLLKCCFTSTGTVGLLGTEAQDVHLDFHTVLELCKSLRNLKTSMYNRK